MIKFNVKSLYAKFDDGIIYTLTGNKHYVFLLYSS